MRPKAIATFESLFLLSIGLSMLQVTGLLRARSGEGGTAVELVVALGVALLSVALVLLASRRRSNVARWVLAGLTALGLASAGYSLGKAMGADAIGAGEAIDLISVALQFVAVAMLWTPAARAWFARRDVSA